jgi:CubicO group peptidase (beta-lactamase class C family)
MYKHFLLSLFFSSGFLFSGMAQSPAEQRIQKVENGLSGTIVSSADGNQNTFSIQQRMQKWKVNGLSVAVIDKGNIAWAKAYGLRDAAQPNAPVDTTTLFQCASIGKVITAVLAMHLVEEQKIGLDEDVNTKLLHWKIPENDLTDKKKVTLRMLLSHSAGLSDDYGFEGYQPGKVLPNLKDILEATAPANNRKKIKVTQVPGTTERYSGAGYMIIQQLIEDLTGLPFATYAEQILFKPLGMKHTTYSIYPDTEKGLPIARGHHDNGQADPKRKYNVYPESAAAGPWTTPSDLARLIMAIQQSKEGKPGAILKQTLVKQMLQPQINSMGLGLPLKGSKTVAGFWHAGNNAGYTGMLFAMTESGQGAVVLTNSNSGEWMALEVIRSIANAYHWPLTMTIYAQPIPQPERYCGTYELPDKSGLLLSSSGQELYFKKTGSNKNFRLYRIPDGTFHIQEKPDNLSFEFQQSSDGRITGLTMYENCGSTFPLQKSNN